MPKTTASITIGEPDTAILVALNRFNYMTAAQINRLLYPNLTDENRYVLRRLKRLVDAKLVMRLATPPARRYGAAPHVFTLANSGKRYVGELGIETPPYFRPSEEGTKGFNRLFIEHTLAAVDVLIAADMLCHEEPVTCPRLVCERELKRSAVTVEVPPAPGSLSGEAQRMSVVPDGWFQLSVKDAPPQSFALELDRGTEEQKLWRRKVAKIKAWAEGPYEDAFDTDNVTIAVVTPTPRRRDTLRHWTVLELANRGWTDYEEIFLFTSADPVLTSPRALFFDRLWYLPTGEPPVSLLEWPEDEHDLTHAGLFCPKGIFMLAVV